MTFFDVRATVVTRVQLLFERVEADTAAEAIAMCQNSGRVIDPDIVGIADPTLYDETWHGAYADEVLEEDCVDAAEEGGI